MKSWLSNIVIIVKLTLKKSSSFLKKAGILKIKQKVLYHYRKSLLVVADTYAQIKFLPKQEGQKSS